MQLISTEPQHMARLINSFEECTRLNISTRKQAIQYVGSKVGILNFQSIIFLIFYYFFLDKKLRRRAASNAACRSNSAE